MTYELVTGQRNPRDMNLNDNNICRSAYFRYERLLSKRPRGRNLIESYMRALAEPQTIIKKRVEVRKSGNASLIDEAENINRYRGIFYFLVHHRQLKHSFCINFLYFTEFAEIVKNAAKFESMVQNVCY